MEATRSSWDESGAHTRATIYCKAKCPTGDVGDLLNGGKEGSQEGR